MASKNDITVKVGLEDDGKGGQIFGKMVSDAKKAGTQINKSLRVGPNGGGPGGGYGGAAGAAGGAAGEAFENAVGRVFDKLNQFIPSLGDTLQRALGSQISNISQAISNAFSAGLARGVGDAIGKKAAEAATQAAANAVGSGAGSGVGTAVGSASGMAGVAAATAKSAAAAQAASTAAMVAAAQAVSPPADPQLVNTLKEARNDAVHGVTPGPGPVKRPIPAYVAAPNQSDKWAKALAGVGAGGASAGGAGAGEAAGEAAATGAAIGASWVTFALAGAATIGAAVGVAQYAKYTELFDAAPKAWEDVDSKLRKAHSVFQAKGNAMPYNKFQDQSMDRLGKAGVAFGWSTEQMADALPDLAGAGFNQADAFDALDTVAVGAAAVGGDMTPQKFAALMQGIKNGRLKPRALQAALGGTVYKDAAIPETDEAEEQMSGELQQAAMVAYFKKFMSQDMGHLLGEYGEQREAYYKRQKTLDIGKLLDPVADRLANQKADVAREEYMNFEARGGAPIEARKAGRWQALKTGVSEGAYNAWGAVRNAGGAVGTAVQGDFAYAAGTLADSVRDAIRAEVALSETIRAAIPGGAAVIPGLNTFIPVQPRTPAVGPDGIMERIYGTALDVNGAEQRAQVQRSSGTDMSMSQEGKDFYAREKAAKAAKEAEQAAEKEAREKEREAEAKSKAASELQAKIGQVRTVNAVRVSIPGGSQIVTENGSPAPVVQNRPAMKPAWAGGGMY